MKKTTVMASQTRTFVYLYGPGGQLLQEVEKKAGATDHVRAYVYLEDELIGLVDSVMEVGSTGLWPLPRLRRQDFEGPGWMLLALAGASGLLLLAARRHPAPATAASSALLVIFTCAGTQRPPALFSWVHTDPLGTPLAVSSTALFPHDTKVTWRAQYEPFGRATVDEDPDVDQTLLSLAVRFPGQYEDAETRWHYNFYRTYDPSTGRYLEADPIGPVEMIERELENRRGLFDPILRVPRPSGSMRGNLYAYALGDPLNLVDRDGADPETPSQPVDLPPAARRAFAAGRKASPQFREPYCTSGYTGCMSACSDEVTQAEQEFCLQLRLQCLQAPSATRSQPPQTTNHEGLYNGSRSLNKISVGRGPKVPNQ